MRKVESAPMRFPANHAASRVLALSIALAALLTLCRSAGAQRVDVLTYHDDPMRTGQNLQEKLLTPGSVRAETFGKLLAFPVDGEVYAEPLYVSHLNIPGHGHRDVLFAATEHDSVYAFDAQTKPGDSLAPLWHVNFLDPTHGVTTVPAPADVNSSDLTPEIGITGTPVIDLATKTIYLVANTKEAAGGNATYVQKLHALDLSTGAEKPGSPVVIQASVAGKGDGGDGKSVPFDPLRENQRPGLLLDNGVVYIAWGSHGDVGPYHGWVIGYDAKTLKQVAVFNDSPNEAMDGIWQSGGGLAADQGGRIYCATGNGASNISAGSYSNAVLKLTPGLSLLDYFVPYNNDDLNNGDADLASGGVLLLPDSAGDPSHLHLLVAMGKQGRLYLIDRDHLGHQNPQSDDVVQSLDLSGGLFGDPAWFDGSLYLGLQNSPLDQLKVVGGRVVDPPASQSPESLQNWGGTPAISANGNANAIVWVIQQGDPGILRAYDAGDLANELYHSDTDRDSLGASVKFTVPTVANGRVFVGTQTSVVVYGLLRVSQSRPASPENLSATAASSTQINLTWKNAPSDANGIDIERAVGDGKFDLVTTVGPDISSYQDTSVQPAVTYRYRVLATNTAGDSGPSNTARATTPAAARDPRLLAEWGFDEASGSQALDSSGNGLDGQIQGEVTRIPGLVGSGALSFHAAGHAVSHVDIPDNPRLRFASSASFTIVLWADPEVLASHPQTILEKSQDSPPWYAIGITSDGHWMAGGPNGEIDGGTATTGWHSLVLVQDGAANQRRLYVDGALIATGPAQAGDGHGDLWIGQANPTGDAFAGAVDDVRIYNVALGSGEIKSLAGGR